MLLAWLATELAEAVVPTRARRPLLGTGFCGALTTFSAFHVETIQIATMVTRASRRGARA